MPKETAPKPSFGFTAPPPGQEVLPCAAPHSSLHAAEAQRGRRPGRAVAGRRLQRGELRHSEQAAEGAAFGTVTTRATPRKTI